MILDQLGEGVEKNEILLTIWIRYQNDLIFWNAHTQVIFPLFLLSNLNFEMDPNSYLPLLFQLLFRK